MCVRRGGGGGGGEGGLSSVVAVWAGGRVNGRGVVGGGGGGGEQGEEGGEGGGGGFPSVVVFRAMLLAHRYLSALTTYFLNVGILYYIAITYLVYHLLCSPIGYLGLGEIV